MYRLLVYLLLLVVPSYVAISRAGILVLALVWVLGIITTISFSYWPGYFALLIMLAAATAADTPLILFAPCFCLMSMFIFGSTSPGRYWDVATRLISGASENTTQLYTSCVRKFFRVFLIVTLISVLVSEGYAILPYILPTSTDPTSLAVYVVVTIVGLAIIMHAGSASEIQRHFH